MSSYSDLPSDVIEAIMHLVYNTQTPYALLKYAVINKQTYRVFQNARALCNTILEKLRASSKTHKLVSKEPTSKTISYAMSQKNYCVGCWKHGMKRTHSAIDNKFMCDFCKERQHAPIYSKRVLRTAHWVHIPETRVQAKSRKAMQGLVQHVPRRTQTRSRSSRPSAKTT